VLSAIVSNFQRFNDTIRCIKFGQHKIVFLIREPMYLIAISRTAESVALLEQQLVYVHRQIISILTSSVNDILESSPNYDVRLLMSGAELLLYDLIVESNRYCFLIWQEERGARTESNGGLLRRHPVFMFNSFLALRLNKATRAKIGTLLRKARTKNLFYSFLLAGSRVVSMAHSRDRPPYPEDILILINFVTNSHSFRTSESFAPVCLPNFSDKVCVFGL